MRGETICNNGQSGAAYNPNTGKAAVSQTNENGVKTFQTDTGGEAKYNPNTGRGAVSQTNQNGVKTTHTTGGSEAKTKNGKGVATGPKGTTCAKGKYNSGCNYERSALGYAAEAGTQFGHDQDQQNALHCLSRGISSNRMWN